MELKCTQNQIIRQEQKAIIGSLASDLSHKINSILNPIELLDVIKEKLNKEDQECIELIYDSRDQVASLISGVNAIAKDKVVEYSIDRHKLCKLIDYAIHMATLDFNVKYKRLITEHGFDGFVKVDKSKIILVLINLIRNAAHAIKEHDEGKIIIKTERQDDSVFVHVNDNGCGIEKKEMFKIWKSFFSTKGQTGIGLNICKRIINGHKGEFVCDSEPKQRGHLYFFNSCLVEA